MKNKPEQHETNSGFTVNGIEVPAELDVRHINTYINNSPADVKRYIESTEDALTYLQYTFLKHLQGEEIDLDYWEQYLREALLLDEERNRRTRV